MTPEERDRTMDFILQQQAQVEITLQDLATSLQEEKAKRLLDQPRIAEVQVAVVLLAEIVTLQRERLDPVEPKLPPS